MQWCMLINLIHTSKKQLTISCRRIRPARANSLLLQLWNKARKSQQSATAAVESQLDCGNSKHNLSITLISCQCLIVVAFVVRSSSVIDMLENVCVRLTSQSPALNLKDDQSTLTGSMYMQKECAAFRIVAGNFRKQSNQVNETISSAEAV